MQQFFKGLQISGICICSVRLNFNICISSQEKNTYNNNSKYNISFPFRVLSIVFFLRSYWILIHQQGLEKKINYIYYLLLYLLQFCMVFWAFCKTIVIPRKKIYIHNEISQWNAYFSIIFWNMRTDLGILVFHILTVYYIFLYFSTDISMQNSEIFP